MLADTISTIANRVKCWATEHRWQAVKAKNLDPDGYNRLYPNDDRDLQSIDACDIVDECIRCGQQREIYAAVDMARQNDIPLMWEETETNTESNTNKNQDGNRPEEWPEMYSAMGESPNCPHQMHWDDSDELYRCINGCGKTADSPPKDKIT